MYSRKEIKQTLGDALIPAAADMGYTARISDSRLFGSSRTDAENGKVVVNLEQIVGDKKTLDDMDVAIAFTAAFHELRHIEQYSWFDLAPSYHDELAQKIMIEMCLDAAYPEVYHEPQNYQRNVVEIDAQLFGIEEASVFCREMLPELDFDRAIVEFSNENRHQADIVSVDFALDDAYDMEDLINKMENNLSTGYDSTRTLWFMYAQDSSNPLVRQMFADQRYDERDGARQAADMLMAALEADQVDARYIDRFQQMLSYAEDFAY